MTRRLVGLALAFPLSVVVLVAVIVVGGLWAYKNLDIEAYPDPVPPRVEVITQPPGWSAEEVERYVTVPLESALNGMLGLDVCRSISIFQLSDVKCYFDWDTDYRWDQQAVLNRLQEVNLPNGITPGLSPGNPIGEIYRYILHAPGYDLADVKAMQDWVLEKNFKQVAGVLGVTSFGGLTKQYHVDVDPYRLKGQGVALPTLISALQNGNLNVGGNILALGEQAWDVRGLGLAKDVHDISQIVLTTQRGIPIHVGDVADVSIGHATRLGIVGHDDDPDVVQGVVLMRRGGDTLKTLDAVREKVAQIRQERVLPPGMDIEPYYDRTNLVNVTTHTVLHNLLVGMALVAGILVLFLGNWRAALITAVNIPLSLLVAFLLMVLTNTPANLISLGAVDFGIIVNSTVIVMENIVHWFRIPNKESATERILAASGEVGAPMAFSTLIIAVAFLPLFTLHGVEGVIFTPMAHTYAFAIGGSICLALTLTPTLARYFLVNVREAETFFTKGLRRFYDPIFHFALRRPRTSVLVAALPLLLALALTPTLGSEFMPKLEEGNFWIRATLPLSVSLEQSAKYVTRMRQIIRQHPEIVTVVSQLGRPDDGTDVAGFYNLEFFVPLKPFDEWGHGLTKSKLTQQLSEELADAFPGVNFNFSQNIEDNVEEALSGVKGENTVKIIGPDLVTDEAIGKQIVEKLSHVHGIVDLGMLPTLGQPNVNISPNRALAAPYGLNMGDVLNQVQAAVGGETVSQVFEGEKRFDMTVRWLAPYRNDVSRLKEILIATPGGMQVPLGAIADVHMDEGPALVYREANHRYVPVKFGVRDRDLASTVAEAQERVAEIKLPYDVHLQWAGRITELKEASKRLLLIVPVTLLLITLLVYAAVRRWQDTLVVLCNIPIACCGGILALILSRINFSISAAMGFISIFGVAVQDGILVVGYAQHLMNEGEPPEKAILLASQRRLQPVLMTALVAMLGLMPAALSNAIGSETQKPLAMVVIGGALVLALLPRLAIPSLLLLFHGRKDQPAPSMPTAEPSPVLA